MSRIAKPKFCGYSNCFRSFYKMRGFIPCCELHYKHPKKWGEDGETYTGSVFIKKKDGSEDNTKPCPRCGGKGWVEDTGNHLAFTKTCELCDGTGIVVSRV